MALAKLSITLVALGALASAQVLAVDEVHSKHEAPQVDQASPATLTLSLVNESVNAARKWATVKVDVPNVQMVDPAAANEKPQDQQGHLHYRLDDGPVIATTATKLSFHDLASGTHRCTVVLAGNDHAPLGPQGTIAIKIP